MPAVLLDDRLLIRELLVGLRRTRVPLVLHTTSYWYYRACRASVAGAGGQLSGPFAEVPKAHQEQAIASLLRLRDDITLPDPRSIVPLMAALSARHPRLNLLNLEAAATALAIEAIVWISPDAARGVLPPVLEAEGIRWKTVSR